MLSKHFPQSAANPTSLIFKFAAPVCADPAPLAKATSELQASGLFTQVTGPLNPVGGILPRQEPDKTQAFTAVRERVRHRT